MIQLINPNQSRIVFRKAPACGSVKNPIAILAIVEMAQPRINWKLPSSVKIYHKEEGNSGYQFGGHSNYTPSNRQSPQQIYSGRKQFN